MHLCKKRYHNVLEKKKIKYTLKFKYQCVLTNVNWVQI